MPPPPVLPYNGPLRPVGTVSAFGASTLANRQRGVFPRFMFKGFSQALQDGMSVPLYIHLAGSQSTRDDQRIGSAFIWLAKDGAPDGETFDHRV
ncbi:hypothetical protein, partial [Klebsiella pneumoniae]|uniref:hypothetical protein n=1 Tax=Klebsiella pneumoniae TaxID=573 RepID=UPI003F7A9A5B